ncbi:MAG: hypothetical protein UY31_C0042G0005 [Candidatus Wolfebacteria bacterium GW2011_GWE1_48_7]|uniref:WD40 repeat domain-containing protein n=2 Tax=Candidatus Wolfeibacteriota TaxID=1752735 RepID=A0A0G1WHF2_9BACT|nr:MAG: hypothetical protein UX70_C0001G0899 [Candidatus Wolfebacteria bacterium GW2011_GWB1_47_1]KKU36131.1 MAG: hypothetical protein UX49_C0023G0008 [Candidatus Wolfebacteria bacterium GW2011_GWC2_46_275]KKU42184.1 MAG: hypothetical protein UX58_C0003G0109 [Candidatus Wolfebacteria bacterium GW2011_GWB2_46_69]KKU54040.1 MAG: hypothetical protein UX76_C0006G0005 [Candidatus Wolfebacteria bacterium GW2011_GWC1_47_103]KKU59465.1 MAG: hypothetical protein UX83_C0005G0084 [Candidatus Wolfebacteria
MNKKWLITIGIILGVVALGVGAYFAWQNRKQIIEVIPEIIGGGITPIEPKVEKLLMMSSRQVKTYWVQEVATSSKIIYIAENGSVVEIESNGTEITSESGLQGVDIEVSSSGRWIFSKLGQDGDGVIYDGISIDRIRDFIGVDNVAWGGDGKIAMIIAGNDSGTIVPQIMVQDIKNEQAAPQKIISLNVKGFDLQWPQKESLYLTQPPSAEYVSDLWKIDLGTKKLSKFLSGRGLMVQWSPLGDRALKFTTTEGRGHKLAVIDDKGVESMSLRFITLPDKCVMATSTQMYCAIPRDQEALTHMVLPDEYLKRSVYFQDGIYQIDLTTNGIRAIFEDEEPKIDATDLTVLDDKILFINRYDRKLYSLQLQ